MITSVEGTHVASGVDWVDVTVGGVTLRAHVPQSTVERLGPAGDKIRLFTHLQSKDDGLTLFGFLTEEVRSAFEALIGVNGVGPRSALSVLSSLSPESLALAVASGDTDAFKGIPGVGTKTAGRIVLDLKGKLDQRLAVTAVAREDGEVLDALTALGYTVAEARAAVSSLSPDSDMPLEDKVRLSLQRIGQR